ncbi:angiotensinogen [Spea bombifrons]|uniref:angiotensinogen n=1 Tax=Spea bombifrons TaxID=233779 RepID=UPI00234A2331|nr:angiotensinogen [Spea bombifrons]
MKLQIFLLHLAAFFTISVCNRVYVHPFTLLMYNKTECEKVDSQNSTTEKLFLPISIESKSEPQETPFKDKTPPARKQLGLTGVLTPLIESVGLRAFNALRKINKDGTLLLSYIDIYSSLVSFYLGASAETSDDLQRFLGFEHPSGNADCLSKMNGPKVLSTIKQIDSLLFSNDANIDTLKMVCIFVSKGVPLFEEFVHHLIPSANELHVRSVDFTNSLKTTELIHEFIDKRVLKKGNFVLEPVDGASNLLYTRYSNFKGKVRNSVSVLEPQDFWIQPNKKISVPMMSVSGMFQYQPGDKVNPSILKIPLSENDFLLLVQPDNEKSLEDIESTFSMDTFPKWLNKLSDRKINLVLPKLTIKSTYDIQEILTEIQLPTLLGRTANFSKISNLDIHVGKIINQVHLELEESAMGTNEARDLSLNEDDIEALNIKYNKPFFLAVFEGTTKALMFFGRVINPENAL